ADVADRFAHLAGDELGHRACFRSEELGQSEQDRRTLLACRGRPAGLVECAPSRRDRRRQVVDGRGRRRGDEIARRRITAFERWPARPDPAAIDIVADVAHADPTLDHAAASMASMTTSTAVLARSSSIVNGGLIFTTFSNLPAAATITPRSNAR